MQLKELRRKLHEVLDRADDSQLRARLSQIAKGMHSGSEGITLDDVFAFLQCVRRSRLLVPLHMAQRLILFS